jgi:hypothetical protein
MGRWRQPSPTDITESRSGDIHEISATIVVEVAQGGTAEIARLWQINETTGDVVLTDTLTNVGAKPFPPLWMYHMNIGAHLFSEATTLTGPTFDNGRIGWVFGEGEGHVFCVPAKDEPEGSVAQVAPRPDRRRR